MGRSAVSPNIFLCMYVLEVKAENKTEKLFPDCCVVSKDRAGIHFNILLVRCIVCSGCKSSEYRKDSFSS